MFGVSPPICDEGGFADFLQIIDPSAGTMQIYVKESQVEKLKHRIAELEKFNAEAHNWNSKLQSKIAELQRELDGCVIGELRIRLIIGE